MYDIRDILNIQDAIMNTKNTKSKILIVGGSSGIGLATADEVAEVIQFVTLQPQMTGAIVAVDGGARLV